MMQQSPSPHRSASAPSTAPRSRGRCSTAAWVFLAASLRELYLRGPQLQDPESHTLVSVWGVVADEHGAQERKSESSISDAGETSVLLRSEHLQNGKDLQRRETEDRHHDHSAGRVSTSSFRSSQNEGKVHPTQKPKPGKQLRDEAAVAAAQEEPPEDRTKNPNAIPTRDKNLKMQDKHEFLLNSTASTASLAQEHQGQQSVAKVGRGAAGRNKRAGRAKGDTIKALCEKYERHSDISDGSLCALTTDTRCSIKTPEADDAELEDPIDGQCWEIGSTDCPFGTEGTKCETIDDCAAAADRGKAKFFAYGTGANDYWCKIYDVCPAAYKESWTTAHEYKTYKCIETEKVDGGKNATENDTSTEDSGKGQDDGTAEAETAEDHMMLIAAGGAGAAVVGGLLYYHINVKPLF
ncbi:unnamed protein product [Amoebophrya sp. A120]|nr:unnamed protein product [Amoebophrya sp. A120]|eukprot:GSA120T00011850001.1